MAEQRGDGLQAHAAVDRLGGQCVAQLVRVDVPDPGGGGGLVYGFVDPGGRDRAAAFGQQQVGGLPVGTAGDPCVEQVLQLGVERDVPVGVQFPDRSA